MKFETSVIELIKKRQSKRTYTQEAILSKTLQQIKAIIDFYSVGVFKNKVNFAIVEKDFAFENQKVKLGTYGFISGAKYYIAGEVKKNEFAFEDFGYLLEKIILHLTEMDLGTCWLGGTFSRSDFAFVLNTNGDTIIPAVTPFGFATKTKSVKEKIIRSAASADSRKPWNELFFNDTFLKPLTKEDAQLFLMPLEMLRLAPSASNKQPWRIVMDNNNFHFYLKRTPGYNKYFKYIDLQKIDMGIAMSHFELTCQELDLSGKWKVTPPEIVPQDVEYIVSWKNE